MRILLTPVLALFLSLGLQPIEFRPHRGSETTVKSQPVSITHVELNWEDVSDYLGWGESDIAFPVVVTGYSSTRDQCDSDPFITASNKKVRQGVIALSRDLLRRYNPDAPFTWGDLIYLQGVGEFVVEDSMNARYTNRADIWFPDRKSAARWGIQETTLIAIPAEPFLN
jgi:3D (Asp-Asp-Asp) domain-containing protein